MKRNENIEQRCYPPWDQWNIYFQSKPKVLDESPMGTGFWPVFSLHIINLYIFDCLQGKGFFRISLLSSTVVLHKLELKCSTQIGCSLSLPLIIRTFLCCFPGKLFLLCCFPGKLFGKRCCCRREICSQTAYIHHGDVQSRMIVDRKTLLATERIAQVLLDEKMIGIPGVRNTTHHPMFVG